MEKKFWQVYFSISLTLVVASELCELYTRNSFEVVVIYLLTFISISTLANKF